ncbi:hypothetical protein E3P85_03251 [Wallemia ichthyophaga]|nr:hypothetical protein E3P85_03251 [Wallemia ichthyophaga]
MTRMALRRGTTLTRSLSTTRCTNVLNKFDFPAMSPTMTEGGIAGWKIKAGEKFSAGDVLLEIETDKATIDVEAQDDGVLAKIILNDGAKGIPVGAPIAVLSEEGDDISAADAVAESAKSSQGESEGAKQDSTPQPTPEPAQSTPEPTPKDTHVESTKPLFPSVSRLLIDNGISDPSAIQGTGRHGMLTRGDILSHLGKIDNPRGSMKQVADKQAKEAAEFKPFEGLSEKKDGKKDSKDDKPLDYVSIRSIITAGLSKGAAKKGVEKKKEQLPSFDDVIAPYLTSNPKPNEKPQERPFAGTKKSADYLEGLY